MRALVRRLVALLFGDEAEELCEAFDRAVREYWPTVGRSWGCADCNRVVGRLRPGRAEPACPWCGSTAVAPMRISRDTKSDTQKTIQNDE